MNEPILTRRTFLHAGALAVGGGALVEPQAAKANGPLTPPAKRCILLVLTGGPSQFETWDPKPDAPPEIRGPFRSIATNVIGIRLGEHLPRLASLAHHLAIIRTVHHDGPPVHEAGLQLLQTGRLCPLNQDHPHFGALLAHQHASIHSAAAPFVILPTTLGNMGLNVSRGQSAGPLGACFEPAVQSRFTHLLRPQDRDRYGKTAFGDACARSLQLVEQGTRCVVVNMFESIHDRITWDCHADGQAFASTLGDYRRTLCPMFDGAFATLLEDLHQRGLLDETLVIAMGELGRTPRLNAGGGRDHWTRCWSIALAGGGVRGGQVIGASDPIGAEPAHRPVTCSEVVASIYDALGASSSLQPGEGARVEPSPIRELFT